MPHLIDPNTPPVIVTAKLYPALLRANIGLPNVLAGAIVANPNAADPSIQIEDLEINGPDFRAYIAEQSEVVSAEENDGVACFPCQSQSAFWGGAFSLEIEGDPQSFVQWANTVLATFDHSASWRLAEQLAETFYDSGDNRAAEAFKRTILALAQDSGPLPSGYPLAVRLLREMTTPPKPRHRLRPPVRRSHAA